jgi:hypothetical protein
MRQFVERISGGVNLEKTGNQLKLQLLRLLVQ